MPRFLRASELNFSAQNTREMRAVLAGAETGRSGLTSPDMALGHDGNNAQMYLGYVCNVFY